MTLSSFLSINGNEAASYVQQVGYLVRWFADWSDMQKNDFLPILVDKLSSEAVNGVIDRLGHIGLKGRPPTLFKCQLKLFDEWFDSWQSEEKLEFLSKLKDVDSAFFDRYERKASGEEDRLREEQEREFEAIITSASLIADKTPRIKDDKKAEPVGVENGFGAENEQDCVDAVAADVVTTAEVESCIVDGQVGEIATLVYVDDEDDDEEGEEDQKSVEAAPKIDDEQNEEAIVAIDEEEIREVVEENHVAVEAAS